MPPPLRPAPRRCPKLLVPDVYPFNLSVIPGKYVTPPWQLDPVYYLYKSCFCIKVGAAPASPSGPCVVAVVVVAVFLPAPGNLFHRCV